MVEGRELAGVGKTYPTLKIAMGYLQQGRYDLVINLVWDLFTGRSLQIKFDDAATDQFPLRVQLIDFSKSIERQIIQLSYLPYSDPIIPADMSSGLYIIPNHEALIPMPLCLDADSYQQIDDRIDNYKNIIEIHSDINVYVYNVETIESSKVHPIKQYFDCADNGRSFKYFRANVPDQISVSAFQLENLDDHFAYFFRTDHHWNTYGILKAYDDIYDLLSANYLNIPAKLVPSEMITFPDIEFLGTYARRSLYPTHGDEFTVFKANSPTCIVKDQGIEGRYNRSEDYLHGEYSIEPYTSHYGLYFGTLNGLLEYHCDTGTTRNILIIGDSYTLPLISLIASQYEHTYFLDPRLDENFNLSEFMSSHPFDDLLVAGSARVTYLDNEEWYINP
jgi:hypothetical protein